MNRPPSIRDVARAAGCGKSTVAKALANLPGVAAATRESVLDAARRLGYRRDPVVSDLAARRWRSRRDASPLTLAYVYDYRGTDLAIGTNPYWHSAQAAAMRYGYRLEPFDLAAYPSHARAGQVMWARGYRGLLIGRIMRQDAPVELDWERFTAVGCALGLIRPPLHVVEENRFAGAQRACSAAIARGYRRPGYVHCVNYPAEHDDPDRIGGYLFARRRLPAGDQVPVCVCGFKEADVFRQWVRKHKPDAVIGFNDTVYWWIGEAGLRVPEDVGYVTLAHARGVSRNTTGSVCMDAEVGTAAVELLVGQIHINARGIPDPLHTLHVEPEWHEGETLPWRAGKRQSAPAEMARGNAELSMPPLAPGRGTSGRCRTRPAAKRNGPSG